MNRAFRRLGEIRPMYHQPCDEVHPPGPCNDGEDRNGSLSWLVPIIDNWWVVAIGRVVVAAWLLATVTFVVIR